MLPIEASFVNVRMMKTESDHPELDADCQLCSGLRYVTKSVVPQLPHQ